MYAYPLSRSVPVAERSHPVWPDLAALVVYVVAMGIALSVAPGESWVRRGAHLGTLPLEAIALAFATAITVRDAWERDGWKREVRGVKLWIPVPGDHLARLLVLWTAVTGAFVAHLFSLLETSARLAGTLH